MSLRSPDDVLSKIDGWEDANWHPLQGGMTNRTYKVVRSNATAILKIDDGPRQNPLPSRQEESERQKRAERVDLAASVLFVGETTYMTEFLPGSVMTPAELKNKSVLDELARSLRRLHQASLCGRRYDAGAAIKEYTARQCHRDSAASSPMREFIDALPPTDEWTFCHNDLVAENIIATPTIKFIDWEYSADNHPLFDLAVVCEANLLDKEHASHLLATYLGAVDDSAANLLCLQRRRYLAILWFWLAQRESTSMAELQSVAQRFFTSRS